jgi:hypothetical protein
MNQDRFDPDLAALLEAGRIIPAVPDAVRARSLARASATLAAVPVREPVRFSGRRGLVLAVAASLLLAVSAGGAVAVYRAIESQPPPMVPPAGPRQELPQAVAPLPLSLPAPANPVPTTQPKRPRHSASTRESYRAELRLLQRAHTAYAGHDYGDALVVVAEHARRFPSGHLAEDREALRVKALIGAGRSEEASSAGASFARRFPRSVLLPRLAPEKESP